MPQSSSHSKSKADLELANAKFREALDEQIKGIEGDVEVWSKRALVFGGALFVGYSVFRLFSGEEETTDSTPQMATIVSQRESGIVRLIKQQISLFILGVARKTLLDFLNLNDRGA